MIIRDLNPSDKPRLQELFDKQNFEYSLPELSDFIETSAIEVDGRVIYSVAARQTVELYLLCDSDWSTPGMRQEALRLIHRDMEAKLVKRGIYDAHVWLPPQLDKSFGRRLIRKFGWIKSVWPCYTKFAKR